MTDSRAAFSERSFGVSVGAVCAALAGWAAWRGRAETMAWLGLLGVVLIVLGLVRPALLRHPARWWGRLAYVLGWINGRILLSLLFFGVFTPVGIARRLLGRDSLRRRRMTSGWTPYPDRLRDTKHYERMF